MSEENNAKTEQVPEGAAAAKAAENTPDKPAEKTFTQKELDEIVKQRVDKAKKGLPTKEELAAFKEWQDTRKTAEQKAADEIAAANAAKDAAEKEKQALELKVACLSKGASPEALEDVIALASRLVDDNTTIEKAVDTVLEKYPNFKGTAKNSGITTGVRTRVEPDGVAGHTKNLIETIRENQAKRK